MNYWTWYNFNNFKKPSTSLGVACEALAEDDAEDDEDGTLSLWCCTSDHGSDIYGARCRLRALCAEDEDTLFFDGDCLAHQYDIETVDVCKCMQDVLLPVFQAIRGTF